MSLTLAMIVKPTDEEAVLLDRCLSYVAPHVDQICLTITGSNAKCEEVGKKYNADISQINWDNDFAKARNFNFSQAKEEYILWLDADDVIKGADKLQSIVKQMKEQRVDCGVMFYLYDFKDGECTVKHLKTRIVKNDGCVEWAGRLHEDFKENRSIESYFIKDIEVLHLTSGKRAEENAERNLVIAEAALKDSPDDPRSYYLMANAKWGLRKTDEAIDWFKQFVEISKSEEEKYHAYLTLGDLSKEKKYYYMAMELRPSYPNAYFKLAYEMRKERRFIQAKNFIEIGLQLPKPDMTMIVHNPRDYDYNPLMVLMDIHIETGEYQKAMRIFEDMKKMFPKDQILMDKGKAFEQVFDIAKKVEAATQKILKMKDKKYLKKYIDKLEPKVRQHPKICAIYNSHFVKEESSGKDLVIFCSYTSKEWNPKIAMDKGIGGSEEAVINLAKGLVKDWNVTVYNNCGEAGDYEGVRYKHFWEWNPKDRQDITVFWRHPKPLDWDINSKYVCVDMHDVLPSGEFTPTRLRRIDKIFFKSKAHRDLYPNVPDNKAEIIPNGVDPSLFEEKVEKNPYLVLNTSSPDRHLDATLDIFEELVERQPDKPWKLAWYYGWDVFDGVHANDEEMKKWKTDMMTRFNLLVAEGKAEGGYMINHKEVAKKYLEAGIFLYPTQFFEIHCISAVKAQLAGCKCVTSDFAALNETVQYGWKIHTEGKRWETDRVFGDDGHSSYIDCILADKDIAGEQEWAKETYNWHSITKQWDLVLKGLKK